MKLTDKQLSVIRNRVILRARDYGYSKEFDAWWMNHAHELDKYSEIFSNLNQRQAGQLIDRLFQGDWDSVLKLISSFAMDSGNK